MKKVKVLFRIVALVIIFFQSIVSKNFVQAVSIGDTEYLERSNKGFYSIQRWNGSEWIYVTYSLTYYTDDQNVRRIAYCVDPNLKGIGWISGEYSGYEVQLNSLLSDEKLWRVYTNGYPYKTPSEMGVETEEDAYLATKMAAYAILRTNTVEDIRSLYRAGCDKVEGESLEDIQRRGNKVIDAICNLVDKGYNGTETPQYNNMLSICESSDFSEDNIDKNYYSQTFMVTSTVECDKYTVSEINGFPEGSYIATLSGVEQNEFNFAEEFKIMIPKSAIKDDINGSINIEGVCKNYPIYYGECKIGNYQNYMLCCDSYSNDVKASTDIFINSHNSQITIKKIDKDSKLPISGVEFLAKYEDGTEIGSFKTDDKGCISINNIKPGNIIISEIKTSDIYTLNDEKLKVELGYNETKELIIENEKKKGSIKIIKVDSNNNEVKIPGVKFDIINSKNEIVAQVVTDENGEAQIENLPIDSEYTIKETETDTNYILSDEAVTITLDENEIKTLTFKNKKKEIEEKEKETEQTDTPKTATLPRTGEMDISNYLAGICIAGITLNYKLCKKYSKEDM